MNINIKTTNIDLTPAISDYVSKRLEKLEKVIDKKDTSIICDVEIGKTTDHHQKGDIFRAEIHLVGRGLNAYASSEKADLFSAIDAVKYEVYETISSDKGKKVSLVRRGGLKVKNMLKGLWPWKY